MKNETKLSVSLYLYRKTDKQQSIKPGHPEEASFQLNSTAIIVTSLLYSSLLIILICKNPNTSVFWFLVAVILWRHDSYYIIVR